MEGAIRDRISLALEEIGADRAIAIRLEQTRLSRGDFATPLPLKLAPSLGRPPMEIARQLATSLQDPAFSTEATEPGYLNFRLHDETLLRGLPPLLSGSPVEELPGEGPPIARFYAALAQTVPAERETLDDPWYLVRYSFAHLTSLERLMSEAGIRPEVRGPVGPEERPLLMVLNRWNPAFGASETVRFALDLAKTYQDFYQTCRIISWEGHGLRAALALATKMVLLLAMRRIGVALPERL